ncbi:uncharacterized protein [Drosophila takahashii]|uniref:uncharacterized protein isoform X2 n=1 Tax=Drosophila takahashii TaxID=29030 RepID=UPI0038994EAA
MYVSDEHRFYRKARRKFSFKTYGLLFLWLILAVIQWIVIALVEDARTTFRLLYYICLVTFALAILIFVIFIFVEKLRFLKGLNFIMALIIVELQIISTFALVAVSWWADVLTFFAVAVILVAIFLLIGVFLPAKMDLTLDIAILFIIAFIFLIVASFVLLFELLVWRTSPYSYLVVELAVTITILFVMYHAQTINGNRFAEMRLNDFFLGSLILFHDFLIIFWLTFYWQISFRLITPDSWIETSTPYDYYLTLNDTANGAKNLDNSYYRMTQYDPSTKANWNQEDWFTRSFDDEYDEIASSRGKDGNRREYGNRKHDEEPNNRYSTKDWSVYNQRPKNGFRTRGRSRTKGPEQNDIYHAHRNPDDWDPEFITQGTDKELPFDDRFGEKTKDRSGESYNKEYQPHKEDIGPRVKEVDKELSFDVRLDDHAKDRSKESIDNPYQTPNWDIEPIMKDGDAKGKSTAGLDNPTFDFPLADYQPNDNPTMDPRNEIFTSRGSPNIYVVPKATPIGNRFENPYLLGYDSQSNIQSDNLELFTRSEEKIIANPQQNEITGSGFNLQGDEMQGQQFSARKPNFISEKVPVWEELSEDEMRRMSKKQITKPKDRPVEPLITREPYPINLPDYEKLVMNGSASILI